MPHFNPSSPSHPGALTRARNPILTAAALLATLTLCLLTSGCGLITATSALISGPPTYAPPPPDPELIPAEGQEFAMPEPGTFDPEFAGKFIPCRDIPEDFLAERGYWIDLEFGMNFEPWNCHIRPNQPSKYSVEVAQVWSSSIEAFEQTHTRLPGAEIHVDNAIAMISNDAPETDCSVFVETKYGVIAVLSSRMAKHSNADLVCKPAIELFNSLYS